MGDPALVQLLLENQIVVFSFVGCQLCLAVLYYFTLDQRDTGYSGDEDVLESNVEEGFTEKKLHEEIGELVQVLGVVIQAKVGAEFF